MDWRFSDEGAATTLPGELWGEDEEIPVTVVVADGTSEESDPESALSEGQQTTFELLRDHGAEIYRLLTDALEERYGMDDEEQFDTHEEGGYEADPRSSYETHAEGRYQTDADTGFGRPADQAPAAELFDSYDDYGETEETTEEPFDERFAIEEIFVFPSTGPSAEWGAVISADFEPEHGVGVIFDYNEVEHVGYQDVIYSRLR